MFSCVLGLILGIVIKPGSGVNEEGKESRKFHRNSLDNFLDLLRTLDIGKEVKGHDIVSKKYDDCMGYSYVLRAI